MMAFVFMQQVAEYIAKAAADFGPHMVQAMQGQQLEVNEDERTVYVAHGMWALGQVGAEGWQVCNGDGGELGPLHVALHQAVRYLLLDMLGDLVDIALECIEVPGTEPEEVPTGQCGCGRELWGGEGMCGVCREADELAGMKLFRDSGGQLGPDELARLERYEAELAAAMGPAGDLAFDAARERAGR
jgi:hypothetical protein